MTGKSQYDVIFALPCDPHNYKKFPSSQQYNFFVNAICTNKPSIFHSATGNSFNLQLKMLRICGCLEITYGFSGCRPTTTLSSRKRQSTYRSTLSLLFCVTLLTRHAKPRIVSRYINCNINESSVTYYYVVTSLRGIYLKHSIGWLLCTYLTKSSTLVLRSFNRRWRSKNSYSIVVPCTEAALHVLETSLQAVRGD